MWKRRGEALLPLLNIAVTLAAIVVLYIFMPGPAHIQPPTHTHRLFVHDTYTSQTEFDCCHHKIKMKSATIAFLLLLLICTAEIAHVQGRINAGKATLSLGGARKRRKRNNRNDDEAEPSP